MRRLLTAVVFAAVLASGVVRAQGDVDELTVKLESAAGAERVEVLNDLARATYGNSPQKGLDYSGQALDLARRIGDAEGEINALNNIGICHYFLAEYDQALDYYSRSLALAEAAGDDEGIANALNNTGIIHYMWGDYDKTLEYYSRTLEIRKQTGDRIGLAEAYNNLGNVYYSAERYDEALEYLQQSLTLYEERGDEKRFASSLNNIGLLLFRLERYDEALQRMERALAIAERIDDKPGLALSLNNIGMVYDSRGRHRESLEFYERSLRVRQQLEDRQGVAVGLHNVGQSYAKLGDFEKSLRYLENSLELAQELKVREIERDTFLGLADTYTLMGDHRNALDQFKRYKSVNDDLFDEETSQRLAELQSRHDIEKKDREIEVLRKNQEIQRLVRNVGLVGALLLVVLIVLLYNRYRLKDRANREMRKAHEALRVAQAEREKAARAELAHVSRVSTMGELATTLAHELNQPLTAILSNAQATRRLIAGSQADPAELDEALADIVDGAGRSREIIQRMRSLLRRGDIIREPLDINEALRGIETFARADARQLSVNLVMDLAPDLPQILGDRIQLQQVVLNILHNGAEAMAGAAQDESDLVIRTALADAGMIVVAVLDAGPPLDDELVSRMFEPFFTTKQDGLGMGLPICATIVEAHGGRLWASRNPDFGLTVQFTLPGLTGAARSDRKASDAA